MQGSKHLSNQFDVKNPDEKGVLNTLSKSQDDELHLPKCTLVPSGTGQRGREGISGRNGGGGRRKLSPVCEACMAMMWNHWAAACA